MPAKQTRNSPAKAAAAETAPAKAAAAKATPKAAPAKAAKPAKAVRPQTESGEQPDEGIEEEVPLNRAERRAKGRGKSLAQVPGGRGKVSGSHGPAQAQRNWASRRSG